MVTHSINDTYVGPIHIHIQHSTQFYCLFINTIAQISIKLCIDEQKPQDCNRIKSEIGFWPNTKRKITMCKKWNTKFNGKIVLIILTIYRLFFSQYSLLFIAIQNKTTSFFYFSRFNCTDYI